MNEINKKRLVFLVIASGVFLSTLDSSMVNIALPIIMAEFRTPLHKTEWVVMAYLLTTSITLLFWGNVSDRLGRGRLYAIGFLVFGLGSMGCAFSGTMSTLIGFRVFQALGAAMMMANGPAIIRDVFPPEKLGRSMGLIGVPVSLGLMTGPLVGGYVIEFFSWRALFLLSLPISIIFGCLAYFILPSCRSSQGVTSFDWLGVVLWSMLLFLASLIITHLSAPVISWTTAVMASCVFGITLFFFVKIEGKVKSPIFPLTLLKKSFFSIGLISALLSFQILFSALILTPFYLNLILHLSPAKIGLVMTAISLSALIVAPIAGWCSDFIGAKILSTLGLCFSTVGLILLATVTSNTSPVSVAFRLLFFGIGQAIFLSPNSASVLGRLGRKNSGTAAALLATARNVGMMLGIGLAGFIFSFYFRIITGGMDFSQSGVDFEQDFCLAFRYTFLTLSAVGVSATFLSWQRPIFNRGKRNPAD